MEFKFDYQALGTHWEITVWDELRPEVLADLKNELIRQTTEFDETYSRFKKTSLIWSLADRIGVFEVPADFMAMLKIYFRLYDLSDGKFSPLIGRTLSDMGYDIDYRLQPLPVIGDTADLPSAVKLLDETHCELTEPVLFDLGGLGKGFLVDKLAGYLRRRNVKSFLINGGGDMVYQGEGIRVGLEDPGHIGKVIGVLNLKQGAMCGSGSNRRHWGEHHHIINPQTKSSPKEILATWVLADQAVMADGLASCLFLTAPDNFNADFDFDYCILNKDYKIKRSVGFGAELFNG